MTAEKLLLLSDIHYPTGRSREVFSILRKERPDIVALLGDVVAASKEALVDYYRSFFDSYAFPLESTVLVLGDNDFGTSPGFRNFIDGLNTLATSYVFVRYGNLFLTHGNIEGRGVLSPFLEGAGGYLAKMLRPIAPSLLSSAVRLRYSVRDGEYLFLGHIHYLGKVSSTNSVFCGTFSTEKIVYPPELSLGYVTAELTRSRVSGPGAVFLHHLTPVL